MVKQGKHISRPPKTPLSRAKESHVSCSVRERNVDSLATDNDAENSEITNWLGIEVVCFFVGVLMSSISAVLHNWGQVRSWLEASNESSEQSTQGESAPISDVISFILDKRNSILDKIGYFLDKIDSMSNKIDPILKHFPCFAEDAGLSIILALLGVVAGLAVAVAIENLSQNHTFRFKLTSRMVIRLSKLSAFFLGLSAASFLLCYGKLYGTLLILGILICFTTLYGVGDISLNYSTRVKELRSSLKMQQKELKKLADFSSGKKGVFVFRSIAMWNICINVMLFFGPTIWMLFNRSKWTFTNFAISFTLALCCCFLIHVLGILLYESTTVFDNPFKKVWLLWILYILLIPLFAVIPMFYWSMSVFALTSENACWYFGFVLLLILWACCRFLLCRKNRPFLFAKKRAKHLNRKINLNCRLIALMQTEGV